VPGCELTKDQLKSTRTGLPGPIQHRTGVHRPTRRTWCPLAPLGILTGCCRFGAGPFDYGRRLAGEPARQSDEIEG
jgi:hypothetical protein